MTEPSIRVPAMPAQSVGDLARDLDDATIEGDRSTPVAGVAFDSREVVPAGMFVAIRGGYVDGHQYLQHALGRGATSALVEPETRLEEIDGYRAVVRVTDTRQALARVAARYFGFPSRSLRLVGVTGTDGKTTTSHMIEAIVRSSGLTTGLIGTVAVRIGATEDLHESRQTTPESLQVQGYLAAMRTAGVDIAVLEATSHGLALHRLDGCEFDVGVVTNITHEHLDFHGTVEQYRLAKGSLLERVAVAKASGKRGAVVLNVDDEGTRSIASLAAGCEIFAYSPSGAPGAQIVPHRIDAGSRGIAFELVTPAGTADVRLPMPGRYNVANALAAAGAALALGLTPEQISRGLESMAPVPGRMETVDEGQPFAVVVDYAHTPEALATLLRELRPATSGRLLALFGSAGERDIEKRKVQGRIGVELADFAVFSSEDPRFEDPDAIIEQIAAGAIESGRRPGVHFVCIEDRAQAIRAILEMARPGDTVVLAGKGHEHSMIYGAERRPWDEAGQARVALRELGYAAMSPDDAKEPVR